MIMERGGKMSALWRIVFFLYNLLLLLLGTVMVAAAMGRHEPLDYINLVLSTPENRIILGAAGILLIVLAVLCVFSSLKREPRAKSVIVENNVSGEVSITIEAVKTIIMKAVKKVEGVKEIKAVVSSGNNGLSVYLHMMINPEYSVPEMSTKIQDIVKEYLEDIGGLQVDEIKILVDDFGTAGKTAGN